MIAIVIPINTDTAARAEAAIDWLRQLSNQQKRGHALLVFDGVHPEFHERIKITSELAFESFDELIPASKDTPQKMLSQIARRNHQFISAAEHCQKNFRCPWLWLEPEATPTNSEWLANIEKAYEGQPRRYLMCHLKATADSTDRFPLAVGVWHMGSFNDMAKLVADNPDVPFENVAGMHIVTKSTKSRAFQFLKIVEESDFAKVWPEAQIVSSDVSGAFIEHLREKGVHLPKLTFKEAYDAQIAASGVAPPQDSRIPNPDWRNPEPGEVTGVSTSAVPNGDGTFHLETKYEIPVPKIDLRTKAGRALKAAKNGNGHTEKV